MSLLQIVNKPSCKIEVYSAQTMQTCKKKCNKTVYLLWETYRRSIAFVHIIWNFQNLCSSTSWLFSYQNVGSSQSPTTRKLHFLMTYNLESLLLY
jgi:hypothetical protein